MAKKKKIVFGENVIRIRMYRVGFGDCFLVSFPRANVPDGEDKHRHVLIDCGVHAKGDLDLIDRAVDQIGEATRHKLAVVIATHSHQDHISGFSEKFTKFDIDEVWMPWCEDTRDKTAMKLQKKHALLTEQLREHFAAEARITPMTKKRASAVAAVANLVQNKNALGLLRSGFSVNAQVRYLSAGDSLKDPAGVAGLSVNFLGPPHDTKFLSQMDPPAGQRYLALSGNHAERLNVVEPFAFRWRLTNNRPEVAKLKFSARDTKEFKNALAGPSLDSLAFALDQAKNNTSLVTLFNFRGQRLLFPGDAQWGNWRFWLEKEDAEAILSGITFFKVAHHGSHNATPKSALERMTKGAFAAMVSTQEVPWKSIPRKPLMKRLGEMTNNRVVRSDSLTVEGLINAPKGPKLKTLPHGYERGDFWYDYLIQV
jgi:hypothetical protein